MAHSQTAHRLAKSLVRAGLRLIVTMTELPGVPERRRDPEPHAPRGRIHRRVGALRTDRSAHRTSRPRQTHPVGTPAFRPSACATAQAFDHKTSVPAGKTSRRRKGKRTTRRQANHRKAGRGREGKRTGSPRDAHTEPHDPDRPHPVGKPAFQSSACATAQAFDHKASVPTGRTSRRQERKRTAGRQADQECSQRHPPVSVHGRTSRTRGRHSSLEFLSFYRLIGRHYPSPSPPIPAHRGRPPIGRPQPEALPGAITPRTSDEFSYHFQTNPRIAPSLGFIPK